MTQVDLWTLENELRTPDTDPLCGVDEAGRGPLAGPVCAAAVMLPPGLVIPGLNDSKKLSEKKSFLSVHLRKKALMSCAHLSSKRHRRLLKTAPCCGILSKRATPWCSACPSIRPLLKAELFFLRFTPYEIFWTPMPTRLS